MAQTTALLNLIQEFETAFADPEAIPAQASVPFVPSEPDEEGATGETPQAKASPGLSSIESEMGWCYHCLDQLGNDQDLLKLAGGLLTQIADLATKRRHLAMAGDRIETDAECGGVIEFELDPNRFKTTIIKGHITKITERLPIVYESLDLPETFARQSVEGCPSGMCPIDH